MTLRYSKAPSTRQLKVGELIKRIVSDIFIKEGMEMPTGGILTIAEARISADLSAVTIFWTLLNNDSNLDDKKLVRKYLDDKTPFIRKMMSQKIILKKMPHLRFVEKKAEDSIDKLYCILSNIK